MPHRNLMIDRDIKPVNIPVDAAEQPKLLDLGIAKILTSLTRPARRSVCSCWTMPATCRSAARPRSTATGIYSLVAVLCRLLTWARDDENFSGSPAAMLTQSRSICEPEAPSLAAAISSGEL